MNIFSLLIQNILGRLVDFSIGWLILSVEVLGPIRIIEIGRLIHLVGINFIYDERAQHAAFSFGLLYILSVFHKQERLLGNGLHSLSSHTNPVKQPLLRDFLPLS